MNPFSVTTHWLAGAVMLLAAAFQAQDGGARPGAPAPAVVRAYAPVNGLRLYYEIHGRAENGRPPLVLLHGGGSTIDSNFAELLPLLARHRQVIAFEQQGHGRTNDVAERAFSFEQSADDTAALLATLKIAKADFLGHSNGGHVLLQLAIRHPELIDKMILESTPFARDGFQPGFFDGLAHATLADMPTPLRDAYLKAAPDPSRLQSFFDKSQQRMLAFKDFDRAALHAIAAPTLVMIGDADVERPEHAVETFRLLPHAQLAILPGTDHPGVTGARAGWQAPMVEAFLDAPVDVARN